MVKYVHKRSIQYSGSLVRSFLLNASDTAGRFEKMFKSYNQTLAHLALDNKKNKEIKITPLNFI